MLNRRIQQLTARRDRVMCEYDQMVARGVAPVIARRELLKVRDELQAAPKEMVTLKQNVKQAAAELDKACLVKGERIGYQVQLYRAQHGRDPSPEVVSQIKKGIQGREVFMGEEHHNDKKSVEFVVS